jgi:outer membrane murein-binding lipoprotein Lpp
MRSRSARGRRRFFVGAAAVAAASALSGCGSSNSTKTFCTQLAAQVNTLKGNIGDKTQLAAVVAAYDSLGKIAPDAVKTDWSVMTGVFDSLGRADLSQADQRNQALAQAFSQQFQTASQNVTIWADQNCQVDLAPTTTVAATGTTAVPPKG